MAFELLPLPYDYDALEPYMSKQTLEFHYDKHHATYVTTLNNLTKDTELANKSLVDVILATYNDISKTSIFNNAAQVWNHTFFWNCLKAGGGGAPSGKLADKINADFGSFDQFKAEFKAMGATQFGSGYVWLVQDENGMLKVFKTINAVSPLISKQTPLLTCDVWEHAYYLDYQNRRPDFLQTFLDHLVNWEFVSKQFAST